MDGGAGSQDAGLLFTTVFVPSISAGDEFYPDPFRRNFYPKKKMGHGGDPFRPCGYFFRSMTTFLFGKEGQVHIREGGEN
jgi:hypothetical protein